MTNREAYERDCEELDQYRKIGTVEECREAVEKTKAKKCVKDIRPDRTHYRCPYCGKIQMIVFTHGIPTVGKITGKCVNCGQRLEEE